ncbi:response regulator [Clostridium thailandense]|uniref:response regulator transcription factor n=1 Tax=Clostridium thailandense TaxID=2794346 RepID=UPI00398A0D3E
MNIVVIDDEPKIRNGLVKVLSAHYNEKYSVVSFEAAELAFKYMEDNPVDLLITDIRMPGVSGLDLIKKLRDANKEVVIVIISGYSDFAYAQRAIELGVKRYLTKPTNISDLFLIVEEVEKNLIDKSIEEYSSKIEVSNLIVKKAVDHIAKNYAKKISLKSISEELYVTPNYLCRLFKSQMEVNLSDYITHYRMDKAKTYLMDIRYKISEVAELAGYNDTKYFSSTFKKIYGVSPIEFRNGKFLNKWKG